MTIKRTGPERFLIDVAVTVGSQKLRRQRRFRGTRQEAKAMEGTIRAELLSQPVAPSMVELPDEPYCDSGIYYLQHAAKDGLIKIGVAQNVRHRVRAIQHMCPVQLRVLAVEPCEGTRDEEWEIHQRFAPYRRHGEWFYPGQELLAHIREVGR